jgi:fumarylacetoacetase
MATPLSSPHIPLPSGSGFPLENLPYGLMQTAAGPHACTRVGDTVVDLAELAHAGLLPNWARHAGLLSRSSLNEFIALGKESWSAFRKDLQGLLSNADAKLPANALVPADQAKMLLPIEIGDYTDFYSSREHAFNVGVMFRGAENALMPNWLHLPVGYHGRSSSIVLSGEPIRRPKGQMRPDDNAPPVFGPSKQLDFELEMAFVVGKGNDLGTSIDVNKAEDHIFGLMLFNDWSARDIQKWEYVPLGPFLGKNFGSSLAPWIVPMEALEPFRVKGPVQDPQPLPYLAQQGDHNFDIELEVAIQPKGSTEQVVSHSNHRHLYWSMAQQLAHHTVNGCNMRVGDLCASGTISGPGEGSYGSMLELAWKGTKPLPMPDGTERKFLLDGDTLVMRAWCERDGLRISFGEVRSEILPALS